MGKHVQKYDNDLRIFQISRLENWSNENSMGQVLQSVQNYDERAQR